MKKIAPDDPETKSADLVAANIDQLKVLFPEAFTEGKFDFDVLRQILGAAVDEQEENRETGRPCKLPTSGWRYPTAERFWEEVAKGRIVFGEDETTVPRVRTNLFENNDQVIGSVQYSYAQTSSNQFIALFDGKRVFDNPKPTDDLKRLSACMTGPDDLVLDFFAGSGTLGHAVMALNASDGGKRRFILVQLPEPTRSKKSDCTWDESPAWVVNLRSIAEITKERLRRAGQKIREESTTEHRESTEEGEPDLFSSVVESISPVPVVPSKPDLGFRVFKLDSTNIRAWDPDRSNLTETLLNSVEHLKVDRTEDDILFELLLKLGLELTVPIDQKIIAGKTVHSVGVGSLFVCLAPEIGRKEIEPLARGIADWRDELSPVGETQVVFRDSAFADDVAKTNITAILKQHELEKREEPVGMGKRKTPIAKPATLALQVDQLLGDLRQMIDAARLRVATAANSEMTILYWRIGRRIQSDILSGERAASGKAIVATVWQQLVNEYGRGFTYPALTRMMGFFGAFPDEEIIRR